MSSEPEPRLHASSNDPQLPVEPLPQQIHEAVTDYKVGSSPIDNDTRLASAGDTEAIWPGRPARSSVIRSIQRSSREAPGHEEKTPYRGDESTSHTRRDLLTGDWTIFAPKRDERPNEYVGTESQLTQSRQPYDSIDTEAVEPGCPFCTGAESQTPEAVWSARLGDLSSPDSDHSSTRFARPLVHVIQGEQEHWDVRVVPNKFPAVSGVDSEVNQLGDSSSLFPIQEVVGGHEVVVESRFHHESMTKVDPAILFATLIAYRDRIRHWRDVPGVNYISVFKNSGSDAGASLRHSHSQLIATSLMPHRVRCTLLRCENHRARTGCSLGCDLLRSEIKEKSRVIDCTDSLVAFCPFASRFAGMVRLTSVAHQPHFEELSDASLDQLASFLFRALTWIGEAFPGKAFNYLLNTCPPGSSQSESFQWSLDLFPRLSKTAGFEWSADCMINSLLPEAAASRYREIAKKNDPRRVIALG